MHLRAQDSTSFVLKGAVSGLNKGKIFIGYVNDKENVITDSSRIVNGSFSFKGSITGPTRADIWLKDGAGISDSNYASVWIEPGSMKIIVKYGDFDHLQLSGSATEEEYQQLLAVRRKVNAKYQTRLDSLNGLKDHEQINAIRERLAPYFKEMEKAERHFFDKHPRSYITASELSAHMNEMTATTIKIYYDRLGPGLQESRYGKNLHELIERVLAGSPGSRAFVFTTATIDGKPVNMEELRGKYVLLDFWASWCIPCRKGNPHLRELYARYKDKGIEFIGIADDDETKEAWKKAIETDSLPWPQVLRGRNSGNDSGATDINQHYGINGIPVRIIIDPAGMIIGRYEEDDTAMDALLKKVFGE